MIPLSASAFDVLWADLGYRRVPDPLSVRSVGTTHDERARIRAAVYANLAERGLVEGDDLDPALRELLETLATATVYVECEALADMTAQVPFRAVAAVRGRRGVLATQPSQTIGLSALRETELFSAIVDVLPELHAGPGYGISLPASALGEALRDPVFADADGSRSAAHEQQIREVLAIQARPVFGAGQFSVTVRDREGRPRRAGGLSWFVTDVGAYLGTIAPGRGGEDWVSVAPLDGPRLVQRLAALVDGD